MSIKKETQVKKEQLLQELNEFKVEIELEWENIQFNKTCTHRDENGMLAIEQRKQKEMCKLCGKEWSST